MDSSLPVAVLRFQLHNPGSKSVKASVCGSIPAFMVADDSGKQPPPYINRNISRDNGKVRGVFMQPKGGNQKAECYGTVTLATTEVKNIYYRIAWRNRVWGSALLDFWNDFSAAGRHALRESGEKRPALHK